MDGTRVHQCKIHTYILLILNLCVSVFRDRDIECSIPRLPAQNKPLLYCKTRHIFLYIIPLDSCHQSFSIFFRLQQFSSSSMFTMPQSFGLQLRFYRCIRLNNNETYLLHECHFSVALRDVQVQYISSLTISKVLLLFIAFSTDNKLSGTFCFLQSS